MVMGCNLHTNHATKFLTGSLYFVVQYSLQNLILCVNVTLFYACSFVKYGTVRMAF